MTRGYWDRDGFHEGPMPAIDFGSAHACIVNPDGSVSGIDRSPSLYWCNNIQTPPEAPIPDPSPQVDNSGQPVIGFPRGGCNSPARASRQSFDEYVDDGQPIQLADCHPDRRDEAWVQRNLGDVPIAHYSGCPYANIEETDPATVGDLSASTALEVAARAWRGFAG